MLNLPQNADVDGMNTYPIEIKNRAQEMRYNGHSHRQIAKTLSIPNGTISRWIGGISTVVAHPLYRTASIQHDYFSPANIVQYPERLVIVGFIAADGCISMKRSKNKIYPMLVLNLCEKDRCVLDYINNEIANGTRNLSHLKATNSNMLCFPSEQICSDLARFNIVPRKTSTYKLPDLTVPEMAYFLRGYFYGDGCVGDKGKHLYYHLIGTSQLAGGVREFLMSNSIVKHCCVSVLKRNPKYSQFLLQNQNAPQFSRYIFANDKMMLLPRKHIKCHHP